MQKILIIKPSSFGDIVHGLQVVQSIKAQNPQVHVTWVVRDIFAPLVAQANCVDSVIIFYRDKGITGFLALLSQIRRETYDYVIDMQGLARSGLMTFLSKSKNKLGRSDAREGAGFAYNGRAPLPGQGRQSHALEILMEFLPVIGLDRELRTYLSFKEVNTHLDIYKNSIILFPDSRRTEKNWGGFKQLTAKLLDMFPDKPVLWMGQTPEFAKQSFPHANYQNLVKRTRIEELVPFIENSDLVISNDSGAMHLTAALGKKVLALFGPTDPKLFGPFPLADPLHMVLRPKSGDLKDLGVEEVWDQINYFLS